MSFARPPLPLTPPIAAPSILSADFSRLAEALTIVDPARDWVHCDVMDNHFVPNLTFGPIIVRAVRKLTPAFVDVHLMIDHPERLLAAFREAGADQITVHLEAAHERNVAQALDAVRATGARVGLAIKPGTPLTAADPHLAWLDLLLVMTVEPGFGGQEFMVETLDKVRAAREWREKHGASFLIEVDGGITPATAGQTRAAGAEVFVAGHAVYRQPEPRKALKALRAAVAGAALGLAVLAGTSQALELNWVDGSKNITVTSTALCTLLVRPSPPFTILPPEWRLVHVGTSAADSAIVFLNSPGPADAALPCAVEGPSTDADREAHVTAVAFCSPDGEPTRAAAFIVRIDASLQGRIAAVASSSRSPGATATLSSDAEITVNGGCTLPYPPVIWAANQSLDAGGRLQLVLEGIGLDHVKSVAARLEDGAAASLSRPPGALASAATDTLSITSQTSSSLAAALASPLPLGGTVILSCASGSVAAAITVTPQQLPSTQSGVPTMFPPFPYRPKEFAFIYAQGLFHLFYIRHAMNVTHDDSTEVDFGHAVSQDLMNWTQRDPILHVRTGSWDDLHVWAPSIIWQHGTYYLFYAGVTKVPYPYSWYQRIGVATSEDLETWTRYDAPVFGGNQVPWAEADSSRYEGCQFRDPFVMEDPDQSDSWLMYYCTAPRAAPSQLISAIARNGTGLSPWQDLKPLWNTDAAHYQGYTESPIVFSHAGRWYLFFTTNSGHPIRYQHSASATADSAGWLGTYRLFDNVPGSDAWFGPEFLRVGSHEYFGAINSANNGIEIREMTWTGVARFTLSAPSVTAVPGVTETEQGALSVTALGNGQGGSAIRFRVDLPSAMEADLSVYDLGGRRIRNLHGGSLPGGRTTFAWDRKDHAGRDMGAGIYLVRLNTPVGSRFAKAAVLR